MDRRETHQRMVTVVTEALGKQLGSVSISLPSLAIETVAALLEDGTSLLIHEGRAQHCIHVLRDTNSTTGAGTEGYRVAVAAPPNEKLICVWCEGGYSPQLKGAKHKLCQECYRYGPPDRTSD